MLKQALIDIKDALCVEITSLKQGQDVLAQAKKDLESAKKLTQNQIHCAILEALIDTTCQNYSLVSSLVMAVQNIKTCLQQLINEL